MNRVDAVCQIKIRFNGGEVKDGIECPPEGIQIDEYSEICNFVSKQGEISRTTKLPTIKDGYLWFDVCCRSVRKVNQALAMFFEVQKEYPSAEVFLNLRDVA